MEMVENVCAEPHTMQLVRGSYEDIAKSRRTVDPELFLHKYIPQKFFLNGTTHVGRGI